MIGALNFGAFSEHRPADLGSSTDFLDYVKAHFEDVCDDVVESTILDQNHQARWHGEVRDLC